VTLIAVTKTVDTEVIRDLIHLGVSDFGESRPQQLWKRAEEFPSARWHLIGPLQTNKVARTIPMLTCLHSLDRMNLAEAVSKEAVRRSINLSVFMEIKLTEEATKHGFSVEEAMSLASTIDNLPGINVVGLMGMAAAEADPEATRASFRKLTHLQNELQQIGLSLPSLSMGMSGDFEIAVEEGATHVRIGSALFAGLPQREIP
jgi:hypothetical protein